MFLVVSICHSVHGGAGVPCDHYPWCTWTHHTVTPLPPWPPPVQGPQPCPLYTNPTALPPYRDPHGPAPPPCKGAPQPCPCSGTLSPRHVQTCSIWTSLYWDSPSLWHFKTCSSWEHLRLASGRLASYWNAFLFCWYLLCIITPNFDNESKDPNLEENVCICQSRQSIGNQYLNNNS